MESTVIETESQWVNSEPLDIENLGTDALVVMFSAGCALSHSRIRQLKHVRNSFNSRIPIILIHVPRFDYEQSVETVRKTVEGLRVDFPTLHDPNLEMWKRFDAQTIPSVSLLQSSGELVSGENGTLSAQQFQEVFKSEVETQPAEVKADSPNTSKDFVFPTHLAKSADGFLAISDPGSRLIMVAKHTLGSENAEVIGYIDELLRPGDVAFTVSGTLLATDADRGSVHEYNIDTGKSRMLAKDLRSPSGLAFDDDGSLFISDAAANTIYRIAAGSESVDRFQQVAGTGEFGSVDGSSTAAALAQPNGMARTDYGLYFCESSSSRIRTLTDAGNVVTKTGRQGFSWGFSDGTGPNALLQRPTDIGALSDGRLVVTDTGNSALRIFDDGELSTIAIEGLSQPQGLFIESDDTILVADTANSRIVSITPDFHNAFELIFE